MKLTIFAPPLGRKFFSEFLSNHQSLSPRVWQWKFEVGLKEVSSLKGV